MGGMNQCPCCKQPVASLVLLLSPDTRIAQLSGLRVLLLKKEMLVALALYSRHPRAVHLDTIIADVWGAHEPEDALHCAYVQISLTRRKLKTIGVDIVNEPCIGYRLALPEGIKTRKAA